MKRIPVTIKAKVKVYDPILILRRLLGIALAVAPLLSCIVILTGGSLLEIARDATKSKIRTTQVPKAVIAIETTTSFPPAPTSLPVQKSQLNTGTPTDLPPTTDPEQFVRWYFNALWQTHNYEMLWTYLTPSFQTNASPGGYSDYAQWWSSVSRIDIISVAVESNDGHFASVDLHLTFYLDDGRTLTNREYPYDLVYDAARQTWLFDYR